MNKEIIEKYIQLAIDNWLAFNISDIILKFDYKWDMCRNNKITLYTNDDYFILNIIELITSKEFIEAITRWLNPTYELDSPWFYSEMIWNTHKQSDAIRDKKLEEFILSIIK